MNILRIFLLVGLATASAGAEDAPLTATQAAESVILPKVEFREASLPEVVDYIAAVARQNSKAAPRLNVILAIPRAPRPAISLQREGASMLAILKEAAAQAGCEVQGEAHALVIREKGALPLPAIAQGKGAHLPAIRKKLDAIILPRADFRESTVRESLEFLIQKTRQLDPDGAGVSVILKLDDQGAFPALAPAANAIPGMPGLPADAAAGLPGLPPPAALAIQPQGHRISLQVANIPLLELLRYVAGLANLQVTIDNFAIVIGPVAPKR